jgi:hypothetical protein
MAFFNLVSSRARLECLGVVVFAGVLVPLAAGLAAVGRVALMSSGIL